jgi:glycosyltransferase involved in cell wall biosynthesis
MEITLLFDSPDENWPSMDLVGEMLLAQWRARPATSVVASRISVPIPRVFRRFSAITETRGAFNADRALSRYVAYPFRAAAARRHDRLFHVVDHSYAQLVHVLPPERTGVYCHDLDAFSPLLGKDRDTQPRWSRALAWILLKGLQSAAVVFHSTRAVGRALVSHGVVPATRLVHAPYGVGPEFTLEPSLSDGRKHPVPELQGRSFVLHVGSEIPRKRLDVVFETFARLRARHPELLLVQQGARLSAAQKAHAARLAIVDSLVQPPKLERSALAALYRRSSLVLVTSEAEGFGFPVIEAMASGAVVIASDIEVLREVGGNGALYAPVGDVEAWTAAADALLTGRMDPPATATRTARAGEFTWERHASTILDAYLGIAGP